VYSDRVTEKMLGRIESELRIRLHRYSPQESWDATEYLTKLHAQGKLTDSFGRYQNKEHADFIRNEQILFQQDFGYSLRYMTIERDGVDGGGIGKFSETFWESQQILMNLIIKLEEKNIEDYEKGYPCDGILICDNKGGRALGHTAIGRAVTMHRLVGWPHTRAMAASVDEDKVGELYTRDRLILDHLPFFLKPHGWGEEQVGFNKKSEHIQFGEEHGSRILYQHGRQQSGIGTGRQFDVNHNTEVSQWPYGRSLELDFFPTLPQHPYTFSLQETTPQGRSGPGGWWYSFSEKVRKGKMPRWNYMFIPFYAEPRKYRRRPPEGWAPNEATLQTAWKVHQTSKEFVGKEVTLSREQLYWWESSYSEAIENNALNLFLSNYSCTPEQSFQATTQSAISPVVLDFMRSTTTEGVAFELEGL
jgi:hypothetical protein